MPCFGLLTQKKPIRYLLASGAVMSAVGLVGAAFSTQFISLVIFLGIFLALGAGALCYAMVYAAATPFLGLSNAAFTSGLLASSFGVISIVISPFVQSVGSTAPGLTICFVVLGAIVLCLVPLSLIVFNPKKLVDTEQTVSVEIRKTSFLTPLKFLVKRPYFYMLVLGYLTYGLCDGYMANHLYENAIGVFSLSADIATVLVMTYGFSLIVGSLLGGFVAARARNLHLSVVFVFGGWAVLHLIFSFLSMSVPVIVLIVFGLGFISSMFIPIFSILALKKSPEVLFAAIFTILETFIYLGYSFSSYFGGICYDVFENFNLLSLVTYLLCGVVILLFLRTWLKYRKNNGEKFN